MTCEDVKAKVYFKCLKHNDSSLLGVKEHQKVLTDLKDEFFKLRDDGISKSDLKNFVKTQALNHKLETLKLIQLVYQLIPLDDKRRKKLKGQLKDLGFKLTSEKAKDIENQFKSFIGQVKNQIQIAETNIVNKSDNKEQFSYERVIVSFEQVLDRPISEDISLSKFAEYERQVNNIIKKNKK